MHVNVAVQSSKLAYGSRLPEMHGTQHVFGNAIIL